MVILVQNIKWSRGSMDRAFDYGSKGWGFESLRDRAFFLLFFEHKQHFPTDDKIFLLIFFQKVIYLSYYI